MTPENLHKVCLSMPCAYEDFPFGEAVSAFKVVDKMFALCELGNQPLKLSVKCDPDAAMALRSAHPAISPGYHLNKRHWNTIALDGSLSDELIVGMIEDSYGLIIDSIPKKRRPTLLANQQYS